MGSLDGSHLHRQEGHTFVNKGYVGPLGRCPDDAPLGDGTFAGWMLCLSISIDPEVLSMTAALCPVGGERKQSPCLSDLLEGLELYAYLWET